MPESVNFLLGYGERLTEPIGPSPSKQEKLPPYEIAEARDRLAPMIQSTVAELYQLPADACPHNRTVAIFTLHPEYIAKSYHPAGLLRAVGLEAIGSRPRRLTPSKRSRNRQPEEASSTEIFVAGERNSFRQWANQIGQWSLETYGAADLPKIETLRPFAAVEKIKPISSDQKDILLEVVLHATSEHADDYILNGFRTYLNRLGATPDLERRFYVGGLCFLPVRAPCANLEAIAQFSFLRVLRQMPVLRLISPITRASQTPGFPCALPSGQAVDPSLKVAVFDGGMKPIAEISNWVTAHDADSVGRAVGDYLDHGLAVTSALLFGPLHQGNAPIHPYANVDHYRVLDEHSGRDQDLYDVLRRIEKVLRSRSYPFVNLSIGPEIPVEDDEIHAWTAVLDDIFSDGATLATVAVGNGGERDEALGFNRVQIPADCVNVLAVGATNSRSTAWARAPYSSVGPGRSPGVIKPDVVTFGGSVGEPFCVLSPARPIQVIGTMGTSFAAPAALRMAVGIRAHFGPLLSPLAIKSLLIHCSQAAGQARSEIGWGRIPEQLDDYVVCPAGSARIVYQGELVGGQFLRAQIPMPIAELPGKVTISATFCYATETDPQDPGNYTRAGIEIKFRPHDQVYDKNAENPLSPKTAAFFQLKDFSSERELRQDAHKWEPALHRAKTMLGLSLRNPVFDIHYNAREAGGPSRPGTKIRYALVITVSSPRTTDLYDKIIQRYQTILQPLQPVVRIPVRT